MTLPTPTYSPVMGDFKIGIDVSSKSCASVLQKVPGHTTYRRHPVCTIAYRIRPAYSGLPVAGRWTITYSLRGVSHGPTVGRFTMTGQGPLSDGVHTATTPAPTTRLVAQVVSVSRG